MRSALANAAIATLSYFGALSHVGAPYYVNGMAYVIMIQNMAAVS